MNGNFENGKFQEQWWIFMFVVKIKLWRGIKGKSGIIIIIIIMGDLLYPEL